MTRDSAPVASVIASRPFAIDLPGTAGLPVAWRAVGATVVAGMLSVAACALVAWLAVLLQPGLRGYAHFEFADDAKFTVVGVLVAGIAWPISAALWSRARSPFLIGAAAVALVSFVPDLWIWLHGQPAAAVLALAIMHVAVVAITVSMLVLLAPQRRVARGLRARVTSSDPQRP